MNKNFLLKKTLKAIMLIVNIPPELIYIIIKFLTIRDIRVLNKIRAFKNYRPIFQNFINKEIVRESNFIKEKQIENVRKNLQFDIEKLKIGFKYDSHRWGSYILNIYRDKLEQYEIMLNNINLKESNINKLHKKYIQFLKIIIEKYGNCATSHFGSPFKFRPNFDHMINFRINNIIRENRKVPF